MLYYRTLETPPDFKTAPTIDIVANTSDRTLAPAKHLHRWIENFNPKSRTASFELRGPLEHTSFRNFIRQHRGPWLPFYMPSWIQDFSSPTTVAIGDTSIDIDQNLATYLATNRPDTYGRTLYFYNPNRELHVCKVLSSLSNGDVWTLEVDNPFPFAADLSNCLTGFVWFVKFASPDFAFSHLTPDRSRIDTGMEEVLNTASTEQELAMTAAVHGAAINESKIFDTLIESDDDPNRSDMRTSSMLGPQSYLLAQAENFNKEWAATLNADGTVTFTEGTTPFDTDLYDGDAFVEHVSGAFDVLSNEVLAWQSDYDTCRIGYRSGGTPTFVEWTGRTPILFQNFSINGDVAGGDADIFAYYLKTGESKLYARLSSENYATENTVTQLPVALLALIDNNVFESEHYLRAMSTRHTRVQLRSAIYALATGTEEDSLTASVTSMTGTVVLTGIDPADPVEEAITAAMESMTGEYASSVVESGTITDEGTGPQIEAELTSLTGAVVLTGIEGATVDSLSASAQITGTHIETAQDGSRTDALSATATFSADYSTP
tara:strand:- start:53911 stop:55554 length:1644 start_codon:yes stop_codon:yes gene_type:complete